MTTDFYGQLSKFNDLIESAAQRKNFLVASIRKYKEEIIKAQNEIISIDESLKTIRYAGKERKKRLPRGTLSLLTEIIEKKGKNLSLDDLLLELKRQKYLKSSSKTMIYKYLSAGSLMRDKNGLIGLPKKLGITGREIPA